MDSADLEVWRKAAEWLYAGRRVLLATVVKTWGSSPRPPGAMLSVRDDGWLAGSVSGGWIEADIVERVRREGAYLIWPEVVTYGMTAGDSHRHCDPEGGTIQLVLEPLTDRSKVGELLAAIETGGAVVRRLHLESGTVAIEPVHANDEFAFDGDVLSTVHGAR